MKKILITLLVLSLVCALVGCMRGGNADKGHDGVIGDEENRDRTDNKNFKDDMEDFGDDVESAIEDVLPKRDGRTLPPVEDGIVGNRDRNENGQSRDKKDSVGKYNGDDTMNGSVPGTRRDAFHGGANNPGVSGQNDSGNVANGGGGRNGSGVTGNGDPALEGAIGDNNISGTPGIPQNAIR